MGPAEPLWALLVLSVSSQLARGQAGLPACCGGQQELLELVVTE